jgi:phenylpropionate dioxygenase-like ring-hydroxylating dioxygenase large terminal subunit
VRTEVLAGMIFINFDPQPKQTAREFFGPIADELELLPVARAIDFTEWSYEIEANWKLNFDNFQENYHLRFIHPRTGVSIIAEENPFGYPTHYGFAGPAPQPDALEQSRPAASTAIAGAGLRPRGAARGESR